MPGEEKGGEGRSIKLMWKSPESISYYTCAHAGQMGLCEDCLAQFIEESKAGGRSTTSPSAEEGDA